MTSLGNCITRARVPSPEPGGPFFMGLLPSHNQGHSDSSESEVTPEHRKASMRSRRDVMKQQFRDMMGGMTRKMSLHKAADEAKPKIDETDTAMPIDVPSNESTRNLTQVNVSVLGNHDVAEPKEVDVVSSNSGGKSASNGSSSRHSEAQSVTRRIKKHLRRAMTFHDTDSNSSKKSKNSSDSKSSSARSSSDYDTDPSKSSQARFLSPRKLSPDLLTDMFGFHDFGKAGEERIENSWEELKKKLQEEGVMPELIAERIIQDKQIPVFFANEKTDMQIEIPVTKRSHQPSAQVDAGLKLSKQRSRHNVTRVSDSPPIDAWSSDGSLKDLGIDLGMHDWPHNYPKDDYIHSTPSVPLNTTFTTTLPLRPKTSPVSNQVRERGISNESRSSKFHEHFSPQNTNVLGALPNGNLHLPRPEDIGVANTVDYRVSPKRTRRNVSAESASSPPKRRKSNSTLARQPSRKSSGWTTINESREAVDPNNMAKFYSDCVMDPSMAFSFRSN